MTLSILISGESILAGHDGSIFVPSGAPTVSSPGKSPSSESHRPTKGTVSENKKICDLFPKTFKSDSGLAVQKRMMLDQNPRYTCRICQQGFMVKMHHETHQLKHLGVRIILNPLKIKYINILYLIRLHKYPYFIWVIITLNIIKVTEVFL